jgi:hypothetical protein
MAAVNVRAFLEIPGAAGFNGWGRANIAGIENPTLRDVWRQLIIDFEGVPGGLLPRHLDRKYRHSVQYTILNNSEEPTEFTMDTPYDRDMHVNLHFVHINGPPPAGEAGGKRRRKSKRTRGRRSLSTRRASRGTRRY